MQQPHPYHATYNAAVAGAEPGTVIRTRDTDTGAYFDTDATPSGAFPGTVDPHDASSARTATEFFTEPDKHTYLIYATSRSPGARNVPEGSDTYNSDGTA